jgi:hypothetical protein
LYWFYIYNETHFTGKKLYLIGSYSESSEAGDNKKFLSLLEKDTSSYYRITELSRDKY